MSKGVIPFDVVESFIEHVRAVRDTSDLHNLMEAVTNALGDCQ